MEAHIIERPDHTVSRTDIDRNALKVLYRLIRAGHTAYLVGGGVRDLMLGRRPKDFDIGTSAHPHQVRQLFRNSRLIGRRFRLVHVFFGPQNIEVATFRKHLEEPSPENKFPMHQDNIFGTPREDALRRDFTVNALFYDPQSFRVIDFVDGCSDLTANLIRTVGDPGIRMLEDPVRMIRAVRFAAKLGFQLDIAARKAIECHREHLAKASVPRVVEEIYRTLGSASGARALVLMEELGLLEVTLPLLSSYLRKGLDSLSFSRTVRNMAGLGRMIEEGESVSHQLTLACLFLDLYLDGTNRAQETSVSQELVQDLRARGFARGDSEKMRLLLEAFPRLMVPGRRTRRLIDRPYFTEARVLYNLAASNYSGDVGALERFLANQARGSVEGRQTLVWRRRRRRRHRRGPSGETPCSLDGAGYNKGCQPATLIPVACLQGKESK